MTNTDNMALPQSPYEQDFGNAKIAISSGTGNTKDGIALCDELLMDIELPRYYRIKTLVLLASVSEEWRQREVGSPQQPQLVSKKVDSD